MACVPIPVPKTVMKTNTETDLLGKLAEQQAQLSELLNPPWNLVTITKRKFVKVKRCPKKSSKTRKRFLIEKQTIIEDNFQVQFKDSFNGFEITQKIKELVTIRVSCLENDLLNKTRRQHVMRYLIDTAIQRRIQARNVCRQRLREPLTDQLLLMSAQEAQRPFTARVVTSSDGTKRRRTKSKQRRTRYRTTLRPRSKPKRVEPLVATSATQTTAAIEEIFETYCEHRRHALAAEQLMHEWYVNRMTIDKLSLPQPQDGVLRYLYQCFYVLVGVCFLIGLLNMVYETFIERKCQK